MKALIDMLFGKYVPSFDVLRRENIKHIFIITTCSMDKVVDKYDYCLNRFCYSVHSQLVKKYIEDKAFRLNNKPIEDLYNDTIENMREKIHERAYDLTLKLLD